MRRWRVQTISDSEQSLSRGVDGEISPFGIDPQERATLDERLRRIVLLVMDVNGVLTDGTVRYDSMGQEQAQFHVADGLGQIVLQHTGVRVAWVSGQNSEMVERRASELGVKYLFQAIRDKGLVLRKLCIMLGLDPIMVGYIGDDWNDLPAFDVVGVRIAVANAAFELKSRAHLVSRNAGGAGAVREVCDRILEARGERDLAVSRYITGLQSHHSSILPGTAIPPEPSLVDSFERLSEGLILDYDETGDME